MTDLETSDLTVELYPMRARHLPQVLALEAAVQPHPWTRGMFESELDNSLGDRRYTIAAVGRHLAGFCGLWCCVDEVHVTTIGVAPKWQRHRIGQRLMVDAGRWALARQASAMTLEVRASNQPAQALYRKFGLAPVGLRRGYYAESGEDALIMTAAGLGGDDWRGRLDRLASELGVRGDIGEPTGLVPS